MIPKCHIRGGHRFSDKIMLHYQAFPRPMEMIDP
jgi:hypothetical protein